MLISGVIVPFRLERRSGALAESRLRNGLQGILDNPESICLLQIRRPIDDSKSCLCVVGEVKRVNVAAARIPFALANHFVVVVKGRLQ